MRKRRKCLHEFIIYLFVLLGISVTRKICIDTLKPPFPTLTFELRHTSSNMFPHNIT